MVGSMKRKALLSGGVIVVETVGGKPLLGVACGKG